MKKGQHCNLGIFNRPTIGSLDVFEGESREEGDPRFPLTSHAIGNRTSGTLVL